MTYQINDIVTITDDALDNYGEQWRDIELKIISRANKYMAAEQFYANDKPEGYHPGYDEGTGGFLYDLENRETGEALGFSLYEWEIQLTA